MKKLTIDYKFCLKFMVRTFLYYFIIRFKFSKDKCHDNVIFDNIFGANDPYLNINIS